MTVYLLSYDSDTKGDFDILDGDRDKIEPLEDGFEWHEGGDFGIYPDGLIVQRMIIAQGIRMDPTHLPTKLRWKGLSKVNDYEFTWNTPIVSAAFRAVVEQFERGRHQFEPVEFVRKDGSVIAEYFWFFPLTRLDSMDRQRTTHDLINDGRRWKSARDGKYVVNLSQVGDHYVWRDPRYMGGDGIFVSQALKRALESAGVTGSKFYAVETV